MSADPPAGVQSMSESGALAEAERSGRPFLRFSDGDDRQQLFVFAPGSLAVSVGRQPSADLVLGWDDQVSRLHARFEVVDGGWELVDDGSSSNGTFVNEERVSGRRRLNDRDALRFGATTVTFRTPVPHQPESSELGPLRAPEPTQKPPGLSLSSNQLRVLVALCRPNKRGSALGSPASDEQIAEELVFSVAEVRGHLRVLCAKLDLQGPPTVETRVRLVQLALSTGLVSERDLL